MSYKNAKYDINEIIIIILGDWSYFLFLTKKI